MPCNTIFIVIGLISSQYCGRAPKVPMCGKDDLVYSSYMAMSMISMDTLMNTHRIHCLCPSSYLYIKNDTKFHDFDDGISVIGTTYQCKPVIDLFLAPLAF